MKNKHKILIRVILFITVFIVLFIPVNRFFQPVWVDWNNHNATYGLYEQPRNTIETLILGASVAGTGTVAPELYNQYGICAYQICSQCQPVAASYGWLQEVYKRHGSTLKTVVLDASALRREPEAPFFHIAADAMRPSLIKYRTFRDFFDTGFNETLSMMMPLYNYHDRWLELTQEDFDKLTYTTRHGTRGYHFIYTTYQERLEKGTLGERTLTFSEDQLALELDPENLRMLDEMIAFCDKKDLELILIRTPAINWNDNLHQLVQQVADEKGLPYLDFNYAPLADEIAYDFTRDSTDAIHLNYYGASKLTSVLGRYLTEHYNATDVRGNPRYAFMEAEYEEFRHTTDLTIQLHNAQTFTDYLTIAASEGNTVLISLQDEAAYGLSTEDRAFLAEQGLNELANLVYRNSYLGIIQNGYVVYEERKADEKSNTPLQHQDKLPDGAHFRLVSGSFGEGNLSSCKIKGVEHSIGMRGLNIVVYSNRYSKVINAACFDTNVGSDQKYTAHVELDAEE